MCKDDFQGIPIDGHPCYRKVLDPDQDFCFDPESCSKFKVSRPLQPTELSFFVLKPGYSNVDVRIVLDVGTGVLDAFLAVSDDFAVRYDATAGCNVLSWRPTGGDVVTSSERNPFLDGLDDEDEICVPGEGSSWASVDMRG